MTTDTQQHIEEAALKPCPFCGGDAERVDIDEGENAGGSCISCKRCLASSRLEFGRKENFISSWNSRHGETLARAAALEEAAKVAQSYGVYQLALAIRQLAEEN